MTSEQKNEHGDQQLQASHNRGLGVHKREVLIEKHSAAHPDSAKISQDSACFDESREEKGEKHHLHHALHRADDKARGPWLTPPRVGHVLLATTILKRVLQTNSK